VSLSEQAISFMAAAAAAYGPRALAPPSEAAPDTPETLGRGLLRMLPGDPVPLADFLASPADPARRAELEDNITRTGLDVLDHGRPRCRRN
jgi:hypothetical protein